MRCLLSPKYLFSDNTGCLLSIFGSVNVKVRQGITVYHNSLFGFLYREIEENFR